MVHSTSKQTRPDSHLESHSILPRDVMLETIQILELLFPFGKKSTQKFLSEAGQTFYQTTGPRLFRPTDFGEFHYWGKRLAVLHDVFDHAPNSIYQMWTDTRNPMQWWTFWLAATIAVLTICFGILSSYTAFRQVALAEKAYQLSLLQACASNDPLPGICPK